MNAKSLVMATILLGLGFTLAAEAQAPVPGEPGLLVWLKAEDGVLNQSGQPAQPGQMTGDWLNNSGHNDAKYVKGSMSLEVANFGTPAADHKVVHFNGDGYYAFRGDPNAPDPNVLHKTVATVIVVAKIDQTNVLARNMYFSCYYADEGKESGWTAEFLNNGLLVMFTGCGTPGSAQTWVADKVASQGYHIVTHRVDLAHQFKAINCDGVEMGRATMSCLEVHPGAVPVLGGIWLNADFGIPDDIDIAEYIIYDRATIEVKDRIESYLSQKYGIPIAPKACGDHGYLSGDINKDCVVNMQDFADVAATWLQCTNPNEAGCVVVELP